MYHISIIIIWLGRSDQPVSYKFDLWNPGIHCEKEDDLVHSDAKIGFLQLLQQGGRTSCKKFEDYQDYSLVQTEGGHDLTFTTRNACTENHYPKDLTTIFRFTCDYQAPSRAPFLLKNSKASWTRIFEVTSMDSCDLEYAGKLSFNLASHNFDSAKYILTTVVLGVWGIYLLVFFIRRKYNSEKAKSMKYKHFI